MILFHKTFENYCTINNYTEKLLLLDYCHYSKKNNEINFNFRNNYDYRLTVLLNSKLHIASTKFANPIKNNSIDSLFISRNFWQKIFNQYWQETIFVSIPNQSSENYINKLKNNGLSIYKANDYKNFLSNFSKALMKGQIKVDLINQSNNNTNKKSLSSLRNNNIYIKYVWKKGINWYLSLFFSKYNNIKSQLINQNKINTIRQTSLPIFTLTNNSNQIIMSESPDQILLNKNILQLFNNLYNKLIVKNINLKTLYTGLFFINPEDAYEYQEYILSKYKISSRDSNIKFFIGQFNLYLRLIKLSINNSDFRLVPDLQEVSELIYNYQYYKNIKIDKDQLYGRNYFQGQPIYIIKPIIVKNKYTGRKHYINYTYNLQTSNKLVKYKAIFFNYQTAMMAWNKFKEDNGQYQFPKLPSIYVSNLEKFLQKSHSDQKQEQSYIFIPSIKTYKFIKSFKEKEKIERKNIWKYNFVSRNLYLKGLFKRVVWSLTSRQPTNW